MKKLGAVMAALVLVLTACGSSRPSVDDVSKALQKGVASTKDKSDVLKITDKKQADCVAKVFVKSKVSDADLQQLVDDHKFKATKANEKLIEDVADDLEKCGTS